jgi:hypothetical protein
MHMLDIFFFYLFTFVKPKVKIFYSNYSKSIIQLGRTVLDT